MCGRSAGWEPSRLMATGASVESLLMYRKVGSGANVFDMGS